MKLNEFIKLLRSVSCEHIYLQVYHKCPCCGKNCDLTCFDLFEEELNCSFINSKIVCVWIHEESIEIEVESDMKGV